MVLDKKAVGDAVALALADGKGKRKFTQSVDLAFNFRDVDFKKPENKFNLDVVLPYAPKAVKIAVFADGVVASEMQKAGADLVIPSSDIASYTSDKPKQAKLVDYFILSEPKIMAQVGKALGQFLAAHNRNARPVPPGTNLKDLFERSRRTISLKSKGKFLPCVHCPIGNEAMPLEQLTENAFAVVEAVLKKVVESKIKSIYVKTTMGKPSRIGAKTAKTKGPVVQPNNVSQNSQSQSA
jgi:large subunit ribosomal protein L1